MDTRKQIETNIGDWVRLPNWSHCALQVMDIGTHVFVGCLVEIKTNRIINALFVAPIDQPWSKVMTAEELINK